MDNIDKQVNALLVFARKEGERLRGDRPKNPRQPDATACFRAGLREALIKEEGMGEHGDTFSAGGECPPHDFDLLRQCHKCGLGSVKRLADVIAGTLRADVHSQSQASDLIAAVRAHIAAVLKDEEIAWEIDNEGYEDVWRKMLASLRAALLGDDRG